MTVKYIVCVSTILYLVGTDCAVAVLHTVPLEARAEEGCLRVWDGSYGPGTVNAWASPPCPEGCGAHSRLRLAHAKPGRQQRAIFNPYDVGECGVQPTEGTEEEVRCHLLKFAAKSLRGKNQRCFNVSGETREITMGLKSCQSSQRRTWWSQAFYIVGRLPRTTKTTI